MSERTSQYLNHRQVMVNDVSIHLVEAGNKEKQPVLFLHGYPESGMEFEQVVMLQDDYYLLAIDIPGIGKSERIASTDKHAIAAFVKIFLETLMLKNVVLVGHEVGGMIICQ